MIYCLMAVKVLKQFCDNHAIFNIFKHCYRAHGLVVAMAVQPDFNSGLIAVFQGYFRIDMLLQPEAPRHPEKNTFRYRASMVR